MKPRNLVIALCGLAIATTAWAWDPKEVEELDGKAQAATAELLKNDAGMQRFFDSAVAHVVIPTVGKAGIGIGGARGKGLLYENGKPTAIVTLTQLTVGFQWGGQAYSEFIFFKDDVALADFKRGNYELGAQASAVAVTIGASADADYSGGVAIFTQVKGGLMYEASVGGQKFKVEPAN
ncbi:MAG: YSC84-related protein [Gammaproteobacteria bacterium]|nr:YSC84-related protein [Gammaproteobacteria bacterium]MDH4253494.1 YSC84-related protein [Gammaproteobacteria bacterium]MDH5309727.1 YSC84-related protein [Gammaproteobacteria bacterium]